MKNICAVLMVFFLFVSCENEDLDIENLNNNRISALGHGGMGIGQVYPLNSFESIMNCLSLGADGTEVDVQMTKDSVLVAFHDRFLEETTHSSGRIFNKTWAELENTTFRHPAFTNYRVIKLDELFSNIESLEQYTFFFDCKNFKPDVSEAYLNTFNNALINLIEAHNLQNNSFIEFKKIELIASLKSKRPDWKIFFYNGDFPYALETVNEYQLQGITTAINDITENEVERAHNNGTMIAVFNTHSPNRNMIAIDKNVDFIQTDRIKHLIDVLN